MLCNIGYTSLSASLDPTVQTVLFLDYVLLFGIAYRALVPLTRVPSEGLHAFAGMICFMA